MKTQDEIKRFIEDGSLTGKYKVEFQEGDSEFFIKPKNEFIIVAKIRPDYPDIIFPSKNLIRFDEWNM